MKKLILVLSLFVASICVANATDTTVIQGQGVVYGHTDTIYGYPTWGQSGEITPVHSLLLWGYVSNYGSGFAGININVDTDYPMDFYYAGDFPGGAGEFYIDLF